MRLLTLAGLLVILETTHWKGGGQGGVAGSSASAGGWRMAKVA
jgi:hypothetical protein